MAEGGRLRTPVEKPTADESLPSAAVSDGGFGYIPAMSDQTADSICTLARCGQCGYWLKGLSAAGQCPECGAGYVAGNLYLLGWARGSHAGPLTAPGRSLFFYVLWVCVMCRPLELLGALRSLPNLVPREIFALLVVAVPLAMLVFLRLYPLQKETIRCELCAEGVRQDTFGRSRLLSLLLPGLIVVPAVAGGLLFDPAVRLPHALGVTGFVALGVCLFVWYWRAELRAMRTLTPWNQVREVVLQREKRGRCFLRIIPLGSHLRHPIHKEIISAEFELNDAQLAELRDQLEQWQRSDPAGPVPPIWFGRLARGLGRGIGRGLSRR